MKQLQFRMILWAAVLPLFLSISSNAQSVGYGVVDHPPTGKDGSVVIQKGSNGTLFKSFEIVTGEAEISGRPSISLDKAYDNWEGACKDWKQDQERRIRGTKDSELILVSCNAPRFEAIEPPGAGLRRYTSKGTYQIKVRIRDQQR